MIHCVTADNAHRYRDALRQMFAWRYELFVKTRGWTELGTGDGCERDQFDTEAAVYLLSLDAGGRLRGSLRLLPTIGPHLLSEVLPQLAPGGVPRGADIYEMTRYFTVRDRNEPAQMRRVAGELLCAMFEYCLANNIAWLTTAFDTFYLRRMRQNKWNEELLGPAVSYPEGIAVAIKFAVTFQNLESTRRAHGISGPILQLPFLGPMKEICRAREPAAVA